MNSNDRNFHYSKNLLISEIELKWLQLTMQIFIGRLEFSIVVVAIATRESFNIKQEHYLHHQTFVSSIIIPVVKYLMNLTSFITTATKIKIIIPILMDYLFKCYYYYRCYLWVLRCKIDYNFHWIHCNYYLHWYLLSHQLVDQGNKVKSH